MDDGKGTRRTTTAILVAAGLTCANPVSSDIVSEAHFDGHNTSASYAPLKRFTEERTALLNAPNNVVYQTRAAVTDQDEDKQEENNIATNESSRNNTGQAETRR